MAIVKKSPAKAMKDPLYNANTPKVNKKAAKQVADAMIKQSKKYK